MVNPWLVDCHTIANIFHSNIKVDFPLPISWFTTAFYRATFMPLARWSRMSSLTTWPLLSVAL